MDLCLDKKPPIDFPETKVVEINVPVPLFIVMATLAAIGILFAIFLLQFNIAYRTVR